MGTPRINPPARPQTTNLNGGKDFAAIQARIAELEAKNAELSAKLTVKQTISLKVAEKGGLSVYGLGRFPVTLYAGQWERLLAPEVVAKIHAFIAANASTLARKE